MQEQHDHNLEDDIQGNTPGVEDFDKGAAPSGTQPGANVVTEMEGMRADLLARKSEYDELHDKYIRQVAEFDNFRKRSAKERMELLMSAGGDTIKSILPVLDDMERAIAHNAEVNDIDAVKQGIELVHQKFANILLAHGLKSMHAKGEMFDADLYEAISQAPAPNEKLKGKVLEVLEKGYTLNDKVLRYAKVVVGA